MNRRPLRAALALAAASLAVTGSPALAGDGIEPLDTVRIATGLNYPVGIYSAPGDYTRLYILEKPGRIEVLNTKTGIVSSTPFLDINSSVGGGSSVNDERGLLGLAFDPELATRTATFYVYYTEQRGQR